MTKFNTPIEEIYALWLSTLKEVSNGKFNDLNIKQKQLFNDQVVLNKINELPYWALKKSALNSTRKIRNGNAVLKLKKWKIEAKKLIVQDSESDLIEYPDGEIRVKHDSPTAFARKAIGSIHKQDW
jgi:hypothetical protein